MYLWARSAYCERIVTSAVLPCTVIMRKMSMDGKRSILKKDGSMSASRGRAVWNETNLAQNEQIKAELNTTKIDEPKTPYHPPIDADLGTLSSYLLFRGGACMNPLNSSLLADMEPLDLNNPDAAQQTPPECVPLLQ